MDGKDHKRKYCDHCDEYVVLRTYRKHYKLFYNEERSVWNKIVKKSEEGSDDEYVDGGGDDSLHGHDDNTTPTHSDEEVQGGQTKCMGSQSKSEGQFNSSFMGFTHNSR